MRKVAIIGSAGRLGASLAARWRDRFDLELYPRRDLDLADPAALDAALKKTGASWVLNCAGLTRLEACEENPAAARRVNAEAVGEMAGACARRGIRFVHFSTDYVFDGKKTEPYREEDAPAPLSIYGQTKLEGERLALAADGGHFVFRVSWVFGPGRPSFPDTVLQHALESREVSAVADKFSSPTYASDVADWLAPLIERDEPAGGLFHLCNSGTCSWFDYAAATLECAARIGIPVEHPAPRPRTLASLPALSAPRPAHSTLSTEKFARASGVRPRPWREALDEYIRAHYSQHAKP